MRVASPWKNPLRDCYDLGTRPTIFSYPPETPSTVTITLPPLATAAPLPQPPAPVIPSSFTTAIPQIPVTWPTSHARHYLSMEYFQEPAPVTTDNSDKDSPIRDRSPSPTTPAVLLIQLEAHEQPSPPWQAWLSQSGPYHPERRSQSPSSEEESAPKHQRHDDGSYTSITSPSASPISPSALPSSPIAASPNVDSPPMQINLLWCASPPSFLDADLDFLFRKTSHSSLGCSRILGILSIGLTNLYT